MTWALSRPATLGIGAVLCLFAGAYLLPDILSHRLGLWVRTRGRVSGTYALTFDDGPDPAFTPLILDILKERGCRATFFVLGKKAEACPDVMRRLSEEGHEIGVHGWDHRHPWLLGPVTSSVLTRRAVKATAGYRGRGKVKFRPPWGYWSAWTLATSRPLHRVMWSLPGNDWTRGATPESVIAQVTRGVRPGSIVLLHDGCRYSGITAAALPRMLDSLQASGLRQVTIGEMERLEAPRESLFRVAARKVQDRLEERFARNRHLIPCGEGGIIRIEVLPHDGPEVRLATGLLVKAGDPVAEVHLDSRKIAALNRQETPMRARVRMFKGTETGFAWIARWLREDSVGKTIVALRGTTLLDAEMSHFGFQVLPLPVWPHILTGAYMQWLSFLYRAAGKAPREAEETSLVERITPRRAWMSREEFIERYGAAATSRPR